jgi:hypothetical protein
MPCIPLRGEDGSHGLLCVRGRQPRKPCSVCGAKTATYLCDGVLATRLVPVLKGGVQRLVPEDQTCDVPLCGRCRVHVPPDQDYCPEHSFDVQALQGELFSEPNEEAQRP